MATFNTLFSTNDDYVKQEPGSSSRTYEGTITLISGLTQKNDQTFPLLHAADIQVGKDETYRVTDKFAFLDNVLRDIYGAEPATLEGYGLASLSAIAATLDNSSATISSRITALRAFKTLAITATNDAVTDLNVSGSASVVADSNADTATFAAGNAWIKLKGTAGSDTITFGHLVQEISATTGSIDYNSATGTFAFDTFTYDEAGHIRSKNTQTITLPNGYKTITLAAPVTDDTAVTNNSAATNLTANTLIDTVTFKIGNKWLRSSVNTTNKTITFGHMQIHNADVNDTTANATPTFGSTFTVPNINYDKAGHITGSSTHTVTIPAPSITTATNNSGNVLVGLDLTSSSGTLTRTFANIGALALTGYQNNSGAEAIAASDSLNTALSKLEKQIAAEVSARGTAISTEVTNRNSAISSAIATEVTDRNNAISTAISGEVSNRNTAITTAINPINAALTTINGTDDGSISKAVSDALASAKSYTDEKIEELNSNWETNPATAAARAAIQAVDAKFANYTPTSNLASQLSLSTYAKKSDLNDYMLSTNITAAIADAINDLKNNYSVSLLAPSIVLTQDGTTPTLIIALSAPNMGNEVTVALYKDSVLLENNVGNTYDVHASGSYQAIATRNHNGDTVTASSQVVQVTI